MMKKSIPALAVAIGAAGSLIGYRAIRDDSPDAPGLATSVPAFDCASVSGAWWDKCATGLLAIPGDWTQVATMQDVCGTEVAVIGPPECTLLPGEEWWFFGRQPGMISDDLRAQFAHIPTSVFPLNPDTGDYTWPARAGETELERIQRMVSHYPQVEDQIQCFWRLARECRDHSEVLLSHDCLAYDHDDDYDLDLADWAAWTNR